MFAVRGKPETCQDKRKTDRGYEDRYQHYLRQLPEDIRSRRKSGRRPFLAFTSNYDVVLRWDAGAFNVLLEEYLREEPRAEAGDVIHSMQDLARISAYCAMNGLGMNFDITNSAVCETLMDLFDNESSLGGTGAQAAAALSMAGFPVAVQLTDRSREVCGMLNQSDLRVVSGSRLIPVMDGASDETPVYHIILQFSKGDVIRVGGREVEIPLSNRLIFFYDTIHKTVPISGDFLEYLPAHPREVSSLVTAGFDAVIDPGTARERALEIEKMLIALRREDEHIPVYMEGAFYMNPEVKEIFFHTLGHCLSVIGTNEEELADLSRRHGQTVELSDPGAVLAALETMLARYGSGGIILHTKDYALFYGSCPENVDIEKGLTIGCLMSGTRARCGRYGTMEDLEKSLLLPLSPTGLRFREALDSMDVKRRTVLVPSRYMERPRYTIGLGDTFVGGVQTCYD